MIDEKPILGRINLDDSYYYLGKGDVVDALNITHDAKDQSQDIISTNVIGNRLVPYNKPVGTNVTIGAKADILRDRVFEFIWNSTGKHSIVLYNNITRVRTKLIENLTDTASVDVLQFTLLNKINHCDIIYRNANEGDLLFWTDGNVSPRKLNVTHIQNAIYGVLKTSFIELAKMPPVSPILAVYGSDATRNSNSLRKKLIMATYRWSYDDFEKSTFTTYSKIPLPIGYYGSDNDIIDTKNNFITFTVETGDKNVTDIEIAVRFNLSSDWQDFVLIVSLNKLQLSIPDNSTYNYLFYNDAIYPPLDVEEVTQLFDWVPKKAKAQACGNGNTIELAAITEGFDNYPISALDVTITAENVDNVPPDTDPGQMTYTHSGSTFLFTVGGSVLTGTVYHCIFRFSAMSAGVLFDYTSLVGDTANDVAAACYAYIQANWPGVADILGTNNFSIIAGVGASVITLQVTPGSGGGGISTEKTWLWNANYIFGLAYKDEQGRIMPGVTLFINPTNSDNDFLVTTPPFSLGITDVQTPVISASINHLPPAGAVTYAWVRRRMTFQDFLFYETCDYQTSGNYLYFCLGNIEYYKTLNSNFIYGTAPITPTSRIKIIAGITGGVYDGDLHTEDYEILGVETRTITGSSPAIDVPFIKVTKPAATISPAYTANMLVMVYTPMENPVAIDDSVYYEWGEEYDIYAIAGVVTSNLSIPFQGNVTAAHAAFTLSGTPAVGDAVNVDWTTNPNPTDPPNAYSVSSTFLAGWVLSDLITDLFNKMVALDANTITYSTGGNNGVEVRGFSLATITASLVLVTTTGSSINYHRGQTQDQDDSQPALFVWPEGDVYFHQRSMYQSLNSLALDTLNIMDANFSDFFLSAVNDNGRALTIEVNARETFFPATIRFSREYQQNTNINQTNRFVYLNFIDLDRSKGSILKMSAVFDRGIRIGQQYKIGFVPMFNQISKDPAGSTLVAATDKLLNPIQYYEGDYGVGDAPECWTDYNFSSYFFYTVRGIWCRLSRDGIVPISVLYKINSWATEHGTLRGNAYKIYGVFDPKSNNCIFAFEATATDDAYTWAFDEDGNGFESKLSYHPEMMCALGSLLICFKNGDLWTHDSNVYNNFFGVQYPSTITPVFNDKSEIKKIFNTIAYRSNEIFESPENGDITTSLTNPQTGLPQISQLKYVDYEVDEGVTVASFWRDVNSMEDGRLALVEGDYLVGDWISVKLVCAAANASKQVFISKPYVNWIVSNRNF